MGQLGHEWSAPPNTSDPMLEVLLPPEEAFGEAGLRYQAA